LLVKQSQQFNGNEKQPTLLFTLLVFFNSRNKSFWFDSLERILEHYPFLEHPHKQSFYMILFVEKANGSAIIDNSIIRLDEPKVICIKPNSVFSLDINRAAKGFAICFTESFFSLRYNNNVLYQFAFLKKRCRQFCTPYTKTN